MRRRSACIIEAPYWLNKDYLTAKLREERSQETFSSLPRHYLQLAQNILSVAGSDIAESAEIKNLIQEIKDERQRKARLGLGVLNSTLLKVSFV